MTGLDASYAHCVEVTRARAKNFYYAFRVLDPARRAAICSIYAFMRHCDDLSDEPGATAAALEAWRAELVTVLAGGPAADPLWPAFADTAARYRIPHTYFHDMIDGVSSDLTRRSFSDFPELYRYCYQVASVAGLSLVHILGFRSAEALPLAEKCGLAFQLTNILRDVREDAANGRVYLPREDLARFGVDPAGFAAGPEPAGFRELMRFEGARARTYFAESRPLLDLVDPSGRGALWALIEIYSRLLARIHARDYNVLPARIRVSTPEKLWIAAQGLLR